MVSRSAPAHCAAACMRWTTAGSGPAMSMPHGQHIWPRKRGNNPAPARWLARRRRAAVLRLDIAAVVPSTARGLGPQGHTGHGADHRCECQAGAVRRDQPADCAPGRAHPSACRRCRCPGILARATTPLPHRRHDLAARRLGQRTYRRAHPDAGRGARHPVSLATQAGSGAQRDGPTLARTEAAHRRQSAGRLGGCSGQRCRRLGAATDTPAGAPQGRDDIAALLAQKPGTRLLATYLEYSAREWGSTGGRVATRVAIYARMSTGEQSPEAQLRELRTYAAHRGFIVTREYVDQVSGDTRRRRRAPEFEALMQEARRRRCDCVLVWKYVRVVPTPRQSALDAGGKAAGAAGGYTVCCR